MTRSHHWNNVIWVRRRGVTEVGMTGILLTCSEACVSVWISPCHYETDEERSFSLEATKPSRASRLENCRSSFGSKGTESKRNIKNFTKTAIEDSREEKRVPWRRWGLWSEDLSGIIMKRAQYCFLELLTYFWSYKIQIWVRYNQCHLFGDEANW